MMAGGAIHPDTDNIFFFQSSGQLKPDGALPARQTQEFPPLLINVETFFKKLNIGFQQFCVEQLT